MSTLSLGIPDYSYADLYVAERLRSLSDLFWKELRVADLDAFEQFERIRSVSREGAPEITELEKSDALLAVAPHVGEFVARLFGISSETARLREGIQARNPLWAFKKEFVKKRVFKADAGKKWAGTALGLSENSENASAADIAILAIEAAQKEGTALRASDEEQWIAVGTLALVELEDVARKVRKGGGATWTVELEARRERVCAALKAKLANRTDPSELVAIALDAVEAWLSEGIHTHGHRFKTFASLKAPHTLDYSSLVHIKRREPGLEEAFVGPEEHRRERTFALTDRRGDAKEVEGEIDYCLLCHSRAKDSCSKGFHDEKAGGYKKNPLGVPLEGCPLEEKISEMHTLRAKGEVIAALAMIMIDNPMCPGTGHRICNDCMKACVFQKQEPVNIPQVETRVLSEVLGMQWGFEIYSFLTRWNPLNIARPYSKPYNGKNVLVVGLGPAGYTLAHHLSSEGFGVVAVDGLKIEPLDAKLVGGPDAPPVPVEHFDTLHQELDERVLLGFGGVSEYGITVRWDKNFLTVLYLTLSRHPLLKIYGGVRFGGTLTLEDAWSLGFDHVAIAAGAGRPTIIDMKNNLARGIRKASDYLMGLQLSGAYKKDSLSSLQVRLPAIVIGGGLTAIDTATELLAYYVVQVEKTAERFALLSAELGDAWARSTFDAEEREILDEHLEHARLIREEKARAKSEKREPKLSPLLQSFGGVSLVYRKTLQDSPAYRLNHEEVMKSLEEGVRYIENLSPVEALLDDRKAVKGIRFARKDGSTIDLPARTVCVAAGTSPNVTYEKEYPGAFLLDAKKQYFRAHVATVTENGITLTPSEAGVKKAFFTSYLGPQGQTVSFYGDNHPIYAGSVVRAMASAKDGYPYVAKLFSSVPAPLERWRALQSRLDDELLAEVVEVKRLTSTIVEVVVRAPLAARKFQPGQFYRLQNFETLAPKLEGVRLAMEGLALTGAWVDVEKGLLGTIVLEMGGSSRLCAALKPGEPIVLMGPTGAPTEIEKGETVLLCGGGLGNAVLFSIARAYKALGSRVLYFAGYKKGEDLFKQDEIERYTDQVLWTTDTGAEISPRRQGDAHFRGNIVQAMVAYAKGELGEAKFKLSDVDRIIAIGSDRMMAAVKEARHSTLEPYLTKRPRAIGSINSPMQCMMKEICAQCLQKHVDPVTKKESVVFSCYNQDQDLDLVDFGHLRERLRVNSMQEKIADALIVSLAKKHPSLMRV